MFGVTSRYYGIETVRYERPDGTFVVSIRRRFIPAVAVSTMAEHVVTQGDRLDNITARFLGDPERFWSVCHANTAMRPDELTERLGRRLKIPLPLSR
jgi:hypothetical protein